MTRKTKLIIAVFLFENKFPSFFSPFVDRLFGIFFFIDSCSSLGIFEFSAYGSQPAADVLLAAINFLHTFAFTGERRELGRRYLPKEVSFDARKSNLTD